MFSSQSMLSDFSSCVDPGDSVSLSGGCVKLGDSVSLSVVVSLILTIILTCAHSHSPWQNGEGPLGQSGLATALV